MSSIFQGLTFSSKVRADIVSATDVPHHYFRGLAFDANSNIMFTLETTGRRSHQGFNVAQNGAIIVALTGAIDHWSNATPFDVNGAMLVSSLAVDHMHQGCPFDVNSHITFDTVLRWTFGYNGSTAYALLDLPWRPKGALWEMGFAIYDRAPNVGEPYIMSTGLPDPNTNIVVLADGSVNFLTEGVYTELTPPTTESFYATFSAANDLGAYIDPIAMSFGASYDGLTGFFNGQIYSQVLRDLTDPLNSIVIAGVIESYTQPTDMNVYNVGTREVIGEYIGGVWEPVFVSGAYSPEVQAVLDRMVDLNQQEIDAIEEFVDGCVADDSWDSIDEFFAFQLNVLDQYTGFKQYQAADGPAATIVKTTGGLLTGNTASDFITTDIIPSELDKYILSSAEVGVFAYAVAAWGTVNRDFCGCQDGIANILMRHRGNDTEDFRTSINATTNFDNIYPQATLDYMLITLEETGEQRLLIDGVPQSVVGNAPQVTAVPTTYPIFIGTANNVGVPSQNAIPVVYSAFYIGGDLDTVAFSQRVHTLVAALLP